MKPNILLLMADQFRGDCLGFAGHPDVKTPHLDALARRGVYFPHTYSACPTCMPARAELFTGLSPRHNGRVGYEDGVPWNYEYTLAGELGKAGYYTQCVGKMHVHPLRSTQGFCNVELHDGYLEYYRDPARPAYEYQLLADDYYHWLQQQLGAGHDVCDTGIGPNSCLARPWMYAEELHPTNWVTARSLDFLRRRDRDKPFFLMASYVRPHDPLDAPECYFAQYRDKLLRPPVRGDWNEAGLGGDARVHNSCAAPEDVELMRQQQVGYYAAVTHLDHQIGRLLAELAVQGLDKNTWIVFLADHGDMLGDHGLRRKAWPYQGSIHIPLIIAPPAGNAAGVPRTEGRLAALRDILPTLLKASGAVPPPRCDGQDLLGEAFARDALHGEHAFGPWSNQFIVTPRDKYVWYTQTGREQYFDLQSDPGESGDLIGDPSRAARIAELRRMLIAELRGREEGYTDGERLIAGRAPQNILRNTD